MLISQQRTFVIADENHFSKIEIRVEARFIKTPGVFVAEGRGEKKNHYWRLFSETAVEDPHYI